jgi:ribosomal protein L11 methylase PrmA
MMELKVHLYPCLCLQHDVDATVSAVQDILDLPGLSFTLEEVVDQEWVEQIKASYVPVQVSHSTFRVQNQTRSRQAMCLYR